MIKAVILTSGGLDSTTCLGMAMSQGREVFPLSIRYGQRHEREYQSIVDVVLYYLGKVKSDLPNEKFYGIMQPLKTVDVNLSSIGGSALTDRTIAVPTNRDEKKMSAEIPITYVPARNTIFLSIAMGYAEVMKADEIWIGANQLDYSGYPDCREEFLAAFQYLANLATKRGVEGHTLRVVAPLLKLSKAQIIKEGMKLKVPYQLTWSCYQGEDKACGICDSCKLRLAGFKEAGSSDPIPYR